MSADQLIALLQEHDLAWAAEFDDDDDGPIRAWIRQEPTEDGDDGRVCLCPVTAACYLATGEVFGLDAFRVAAARLGLPEADAIAIADSADSHKAAGLHWNRDMRTRLEALTTGGSPC